MKKNLLFSLALAGMMCQSQSICAQSTANVPYSVDLTQTNEGWMSFNYNSDSEYWMFFGGMGTGMASNFYDADDAFVSPAFSLEKGKTYKVTGKVALANAANENYKIFLTAGKNMDKDELKPVKQFELTQLGDNEDGFVFSPTESGIYYFGFLNNTIASTTNSALIATSFGIEEAESVASEEGKVVFEADLTTATSTEGWTVTDANADGATWTVMDGVPGITYNSDAKGAKSPANDLLLTPEFDIRAGQDYLLTYSFVRQGSFDNDLVDVSFGNNQSESAKLLSSDVIDVNAQTVTRTLRITAPVTGKGYISFLIKTPSVENGQISLTSIEVKGAAKTVPAPVENFTATSSFVDKQVTMSWNNPSFDNKGIAITSLVDVKLYENDVLITTIEQQTPGEPASYVYHPETFAGYATYKAVAVVDGNESESVEMRINLDDIQGELVVLKAFDVNSETASDWKMEGKRKAWKYDYQNVFTFDYRNGSKNDSEWLLSPLVKMTADRRYVVTYELKTSIYYGNNVDVTIGNAQTADAQTQTLASYYNLEQNGFGEFETPQFTIEKDGEYSVAFHVKGNNYYVNMRNLKICYVNDGSITDGISDVATASQTASVKVFDAAGRMVNIVNGGTVSDALSTLGCGLFIVNTTDNEGNTQTYKVIK